MALSLAAVLPVIFGLKQIAAYGGSWLALVAIVAGLGFAKMFLDRQKTLVHPLVDLALFTSARFNVSLLVNLAGIFFIFAVFMYQNQFLQLVLQLSPLEAGLWSAGPSVVFCVMSLYAYKITSRIGAEKSVVWGLGIFAIGNAMMMLAAIGHSLLGILGASIVMAIGFVPVILTTTNLIVSSAPPERAGSASAISETSAEFGGALGVALLGSLGTLVYRTLMAKVEAPDIARTTLSAAIEEAGRSGAGTAMWLTSARDAFASGYALTCAIAALGLALLTWIAARVFRDG